MATDQAQRTRYEPNCWADDADGHRWEFRRISATLERRCLGFSTWQTVLPSDMMRMSPGELRLVADTLEKGL